MSTDTPPVAVPARRGRWAAYVASAGAVVYGVPHLRWGMGVPALVQRWGRVFPRRLVLVPAWTVSVALVVWGAGYFYLQYFLSVGRVVPSPAFAAQDAHPQAAWACCGPRTSSSPASRRPWRPCTTSAPQPRPGDFALFTARDDQRTLHPLISLPGRAKIGLGRAWHGIVTTLSVLNGVIYVVLLFGTGQWRRPAADVLGNLPEGVGVGSPGSNPCRRRTT